MRDALISFLVWLSAEPAALELDAPRAAAAVAAARSSMSTERPVPPEPAPAPGKCCDDCKGTGMITHGDGHRTPCPCPGSCPCKRTKK